MAGDDNWTSADRRATWVGLRTLRLRPTVVGQTAHGDAVYDIRSVRLVLPPGASHFHRLLQCAKCHREVVGSALTMPAHLDHPPNPMFCDRCSQSTVPPPARTERPAPKPPAPAPAAANGTIVPPPADAGRLASVEARLALVTAQVERLAAVEEDVRRLSASVAEARAELAKTAERLTRVVEAQAAALDQLRAAKSRAPVDLLDSLERQLREAEDRLGGR